MPAVLLVMMAGVVGSARAATFTVNSTSDTDDGTCDGGHCSLREAIAAANAAPGADTVAFNILPAGGVHVIVISAGELPALQDDIVIDGYTQAGASPNTSATGGLNTQLRIQLQAVAPMTVSIGLRVIGSRVTIRGLALTNFLAGIHIEDSLKVDITIAGNFIGPAADGMTQSGSAYGVHSTASAGLTIGGSAPADRNLIAGNVWSGIVESLGAQPAPLIVELSHYNDTGAAGSQRFWGAGTNVVATRIR